MDVNDSHTIRIGAYPTVGSSFFTMGHVEVPAPEPVQEPVQPIQRLEPGELYYLREILGTLAAIHLHLTRPRWYHRLWSWVKGVLHVA